MISEHERRQLDAIALRLQQEDPDLARRLGTGPPPGPRRHRAAVPLLVCGAVLVLVGLVVAAPTAVVLGLAVAGVGWWLRRRHRGLPTRG